MNPEKKNLMILISKLLNYIKRISPTSIIASEFDTKFSFENSIGSQPYGSILAIP